MTLFDQLRTLTAADLHRLCHEWLAKRVPFQELEETAKNTMAYAREIEDPIDGAYSIWAKGFLMSRPLPFVYEVLLTPEPWDIVKAQFEAEPAGKSILRKYFTLIGFTMTNILNNRSDKENPGLYLVGMHEDDGQYGIYYKEASEG